jgi:dipeptidyl-peptidase-4
MSVVADKLVDVQWTPTELSYTPAGTSLRVSVCLTSGEKRHVVAAESAGDRADVAVARLLAWTDELVSTDGDREATMLLRNGTGATLRVLWIDYDGRLKSYGTLAPGAERTQQTFVSHVWVLAQGDALVAVTRVEHTRVLFEVSSLVAVAAAAPTTTAALVCAIDGNVFVRGQHLAKLACCDEDLFLSADERWLVVVAVHSRGASREITLRDSMRSALVTLPYAKAGDKVDVRLPHLFDLHALREIALDVDLFRDAWSVGDFVWLASQCCLCRVVDRNFKFVRFVRIDVDGKVTVVTQETSATFVDYNARWHRLVGDTLFHTSEQTGFLHLFSTDVGSGVTTALTSGSWMLRDVIHVTETRLLFSLSGFQPWSQSPYHVHFATVQRDGSDFRMLTHADGTHELSLSPDKRHAIVRWSRVDLPPRHSLLRVSDGTTICELEVADISALVAAGWQAPERFVAKGRDGATDIHGIILLPKNFDGRSLPVVENIYAGPHTSSTPVSWRSNFGAMTAVADGGRFVVVMSDGMGTANRSKQFRDVCFQNLHDAGFADRIAWLKAAAATRPFMDLSRVGCFGGSAGGQSAMRALLDHADFYSVAVADCGCHDNRDDKQWWNELWMGTDVRHPCYDAASNAVHAHRLRGKLLLIVGELDRNVDPASTFRVVDALVRADKDFDLLVLPGTGHGAAETPYGSRRRTRFLRRHLHPQNNE